MNAVMASRPRLPEVGDMAERKPKANPKFLKHGHFLDRFDQNLHRSRIRRKPEATLQGRAHGISELDSSTITASISSDADDISAGSWRDEKATYNMNEPAYFAYNQGEGLDFDKDPFQSVRQLLHERFRMTNDRPELNAAALGKLNQLQRERLTPSRGAVATNHETEAADLNIVLTLMTKVWKTCQDPISNSDPEDGAGFGSRDPQRADESNWKQAGNQDSSNSIPSQESSKRGQKRSRQPPRTPDSDDDEDGEDGEDAKKAGGGGFRRTRPRSANEFACPFFKHDPETHGGRGGCREYSHKSVSILLRDHIGIKHLRNRDLDGATYREVKTTTYGSGEARYKEIYAKLFPGDNAGIMNPFFVEYPLPSSWSDRAPHIRATEFVTAAMQFLESINRIEEERNERERQVRSQADRDLREVRVEMEVRIKEVRASANRRDVHICSGRDEQLKQISLELNQRRQLIRVRLESIIHGLPIDDSTNSGSPPDLD